MPSDRAPIGESVTELPREAAAGLHSWKAVAAYLQRDVRTVQRWEKLHGMPVHRLPHAKRGAVYALPAELDRWCAAGGAGVIAASGAALAKDALPTPRPRSRWPWLAATGVTAAVLLLTTVSLFRLRYRGPAASSPVSPPAPHAGRLFAAATSAGAALRLLPTGKHPVAAVLQGDSLYIANQGGDSITRLDVAGRNQPRLFPVGRMPHALAISPDGRRLYVALAQPALALLDTATGKLQMLPTAGNVSDLWLSPDGRWLYIAMPYGGLARYDSASRSLDRVSVAGCPEFLAAPPAGRPLYVSFQCKGPGGSEGHDAIGILDPATANLIGSIAGPPRVGGPLAVSADGGEIWAGVGDACTSAEYDHVGCPAPSLDLVQIFSTASHALVQTLSLPGGAEQFSFLPGGGLVLIAGRSQIEVLDQQRRTLLETLPLTASAAAAFAPDGRRLYLPLPDRDAVAVFDAIADSPPLAAEHLAAMWPGDGNAGDAWGLSPGHAMAGATYAPGRLGQAFSLDGRGAFVSLGHGSHLPTSGFTIAASFQFAPGAVPTAEIPLLSKLQPGGRFGWRVSLTPAGLRVCFGNASSDGCAPGSATSMDAPVRWQTGHWYHLALSLRRDDPGQPANLAVYLDGVPLLVRDLNCRPDAPDAELLLGAASNPAHTPTFHGLIDEVYLYYNGVSAADIAQLADLP